MPTGVFKNLSENEYQQLIDAVPLIAILIAGADDQIDIKEEAWSQKIVKIRSYAFDYDLKQIYQELEKNFKARFDNFLSTLPKEAESRNTSISNKLETLNPILAKMNIKSSSQLYNTYLSYAEEVAKASGGFLRMLAVSPSENLWIGLPMLDPIFFDDLDEEE